MYHRLNGEMTEMYPLVQHPISCTPPALRGRPPFPRSLTEFPPCGSLVKVTKNTPAKAPSGETLGGWQGVVIAHDQWDAESHDVIVLFDNGDRAFTKRVSYQNLEDRSEAFKDEVHEMTLNVMRGFEVGKRLAQWLEQKG